MSTVSPVRSTPLLSFCIPTYNRPGTLIPLVRRVLETQSTDIEVVVLDNGSTDDTLAQLSSIDDPRLVVRSNGTNRGVIFNVVNVLVQGSGRYSVLLLDKDSVDPSLVCDFVEFLRHEGPACGMCEYNSPADTPHQIFASGKSALRGLAYSCHHPTGYFFRSADLRDIDISSRFTDFDYVGHFPFEFIQAELCLRGPAAIYHAPVFSPEVLQVSKSMKSYGTNAAKEDAFFSPKGRLKMAVNFSAHIRTLTIPQALAKQMVLDRFAQGLRLSTVDFRSVMANESVCEHYHIATRRVGVLEMLRTSWWFFREFSRQVIEAGAKDDSLSRTAIAWDFIRRLQRAVGRRLARRAA